jgi:crotonobetainyl-CoA:carnitine CoA-transferase CaiB-like acyl-CoA transferase
MTFLAGTRFRVASYGPAAAFSGWLLQSLGADVEQETALNLEGLGAFLAQGARATEAPALTAAPGVTLITDAPVNEANHAALQDLSGASRVIWINPWGLDNAWSVLPDNDLALYAASGWMSAVGEPGRPPLAPPGAQCRFIAGMFATIAALEHIAVAGEPVPALVDVPVIESLVATLIYDSLAFQYFGIHRERVGNRFSRSQPLLTTLPCKDGYVGIHAALHGQWVSLANLIGHPEIVSDPRFAALVDRAANVEALDTYLLPWLADRKRWDAFHQLQGARIPSSGHPDMADVLASPQLNYRRAFAEVTTPSGRKMRVPGSPARLRAETGPAPRSQRPDGPWRPGALRVADLSMGWAGPLCTYNLAALGADVIKIESHTHFDWWRGSRPPGDGDGMGLHERSHVFNTTNRGKRGITLDLANPRGRDLAIELIASADVLVENYAAGVLEKLGLDWPTLSARNPGLVMIRQPGFGADGPESNYVVFGNTIEGMSGLSSLLGYEDGPPMMLSNACGDPVSGLMATSIALAAVAAQRRDGKGRLVECAQLEGFLPMVSEGLIEYQTTGAIPPRRGNRRPGHSPSGAYHAGADQWVTIDVETDAQWAALASVIAAEWAQDPDLRTAATRELRRKHLDQHLTGWVESLGPEETVEACRRAAVPAGVVLNEADVLGLDPLLASGFWQGVEREPVGFHLHPTIAYSTDGERRLTEVPAPFLGQHTDEVLEGMGLDAAARQRLEAEGVTGRTPVRV